MIGKTPNPLHAIKLIPTISENKRSPPKPRAKRKQSRHQGYIDAWRAGTGGPFALLADNATWTITGNSVAAKTYNSRYEFLDIVIKPFDTG